MKGSPASVTLLTPIYPQTPPGTSALETALADSCWMSSWVMMTSSCPV